ncbi:hypothetical protein EWM64_g5153 [Hericium alpestre]|uniref:Uncharacterized protein n=1 Tax=Hericium alpestre TaxID=135208 RepID=A0A4Y9ZXF3_9AGAM|nr:hypothetical protein EWM64_g5153 [Hericium alpestre]
MSSKLPRGLARSGKAFGNQVKQEAGGTPSGSTQPVLKAAVTVKQELSDGSSALRMLKRKSESAGTGGDGVKQENDSKKVNLEGSSGDATGKKKKKKKRSKNKGPKG